MTASAPAQAARTAAPVDPDLFRHLAREQSPAVVSIVTRGRVAAVPDDMKDWLRRFFDGLPSERRIQRNSGSGFLISSLGEILTNDHVVANATAIDVSLLGDGSRTYRAVVVARDPLSDVALIRLVQPPADLPFVRLGDSDLLEQGDWVMAIGNPFRLGHTVTVGVVSHVGRVFELDGRGSQRMIQTDAAVNAGSSGGPLFNVRGEVIGITSALIDAEAGIGFAIPIGIVTPLLPQLRAGTVVRGRIGVRLHDQPLEADEAVALALRRAEGALITFVERDSPAARAGLRPGDVVTTFNGVEIRTPDELLPRLTGALPGATASVGIVRHGKQKQVTVRVEGLTTETSEPPPAEDAADDVFGLTLVDREPDAALEPPTEATGVLVKAIDEESTAWLAGINEGDVIQRVNGHPVGNAAAANQALRDVHGSAPAFLLLWRDGDQLLVRMRRDRP